MIQRDVWSLATIPQMVASPRYQTSKGALTTRMQYDGSDLIAEYNASNALQRRYVYGPGTDEPILWYEGAALTDKRYLLFVVSLMNDLNNHYTHPRPNAGMTRCVYLTDTYQLKRKSPLKSLHPFQPDVAVYAAVFVPVGLDLYVQI